MRPLLQGLKMNPFLLQQWSLRSCHPSLMTEADTGAFNKRSSNAERSACA